MSPLYRNPDGTWPKLPEGHEVGDLYVVTRGGTSVQWKRLYRPLELRNEDEVLVLLVAHDAFHYLRLDPFSIVCKVLSANGRPAVKLSDNPTKAVGPTDEIERYRRVFGVGKQAALEVVV